jgi:membrane protease subunit HflC
MKTNRVIIFGLGVLLLTALLGQLFTFSVNFDETVVVLTFGRATPQSVINSDGEGAGLHWRWPRPIQRLVRYDRRRMVLKGRLEQQETRDRQVVIVKAYALWHIEDPLAFHRVFLSVDNASDYLKDRLRTAKAVIGSFSFSELTNTDPDTLRIQDAQRALLEQINRDLARNPCGLSVSSVGITRVLLPENITKTVFNRMQQTRQRLAQNARSEGNALSRSIRAKTDSDRERIMAFTERLANRIRAEGDATAAKYYAQYRHNKDLAVFLRKVEALEKTLAKNTTFILDPKTPPIDLLE